MTNIEIRISAFPDEMVNKGSEKSRLQVTALEEGESCSNRALYVGSDLGKIYELEDSDIERLREDDMDLVKTRTDGEGKLSLGIDLPDMIGSIRLAAGTRKKDVAQALEGDNEDLPDDIAVGTVNLKPGEAAELELESDAEQVVADGVSSVNFTATLRDEYGNPIPGEEVSFETDLGNIDDESINAITDSRGRATISLSSHQVGTATLRAMNRYKSWLEDLIPEENRKRGLANPFKENSSPEAIGYSKEGDITQDKSIEFIPSDPSNLFLEVDRKTVPADGESGCRISAELKDEIGNPVRGREVVFETDLGTIQPDNTVRTNDSGRATVTVTSVKVGTASVRARTGGEKGLISGTEVIFEAAEPAEIIMSAEPETIIADGEDKSEIDVRVQDANGNPVPDKKVVFETDVGRILPDKERKTDREGRTGVRITSRKTGQARVKAACGGAHSSIAMELKPGEPESIMLSVNPSTEEEWRERISSDHLERLNRALKYMKSRRFAKAIDIMEKEKEESLRICNHPALCNLAYAYQQAGRRDQAEEIFRTIIEGNGAQRKIKVRYGNGEREFKVELPGTKGIKLAEDDYIPLDPEDYLINVVVSDANGNDVPELDLEFESNFGWIPEEYASDTTNSAGAAASRLTTFSPPEYSELEFAWVNLGAIKENDLDYEGALDCYRTAVKVTPESKRGLESLASVLVKTGNSDGAKKCYYNLARSYVKKGAYSKAMEYYGKSLELDPSYAKALSGYGSACLKTGDLERARGYLEEAVKRDGSLKAAYANLGLLYYFTGKFDEAISMNNKALRVDSGYKPALVNLYQIHKARGERDKAGEYRARVKSGA